MDFLIGQLMFDGFLLLYCSLSDSTLHGVKLAVVLKRTGRVYRFQLETV